MIHRCSVTANASGTCSTEWYTVIWYTGMGYNNPAWCGVLCGKEVWYSGTGEGREHSNTAWFGIVTRHCVVCYVVLTLILPLVLPLVLPLYWYRGMGEGVEYSNPGPVGSDSPLYIDCPPPAKASRRPSRSRKSKTHENSSKGASLRLARYANWVTTRLKTVFAGCHKEKSKLLGYNCIERILVNSKQFTRRLSTIYKFRSFAMAWLYSWMGYYLDAMLFELAG